MAFSSILFDFRGYINGNFGQNIDAFINILEKVTLSKLTAPPSSVVNKRGNDFDYDKEMIMIE